MSMFSKIKAVKDLRDQAKQMQETMGSVVVEGQAAWGKAKIKMNGNQQILEVQIDQELLSDKAKVEGAMKDAFNDGMKKLHVEMAGKLQSMGGLDMLKNLGG